MIFLKKIKTVLIISLLVINVFSCKKIAKKKISKVEKITKYKSSIDSVPFLENVEKDTYVLSINGGEKIKFKSSQGASLKHGSTFFYIIYDENNGNSYQKTIHYFEKKENSNFEWTSIYNITSDRNGISIAVKKLKSKLKLDDYTSIDVDDSEYYEIYSFYGFQKEKEPSIVPYYNLIKKNLKHRDQLKVFSNKIVLSFFLKNIKINNNNLSKYNDIAYYLEQSKLYTRAIFLLEKLIKKFPNRTVAYINLGDAYWKINNFDKAREKYKIYIEQMKERKLEKKIPKSILEKID